MSLFDATFPSARLKGHDADGQPLVIESDTGRAEGPRSAFLFLGETRSPHAWIPPHEVPRLARALYEATGLPVPDLPDIPDPEVVEQLCADLSKAFGGTFSASVYSVGARELLAGGWGRTS